MKNLIDNNYIQDNGEKSIIILENVNDSVSSKFIEDEKSFNISTPIKSVMSDEFTSEYLNGIISNAKLDAIYEIYSNDTYGLNLSFSTLPTESGQIILEVGWSGPGHKQYTIDVEIKETEEETRQNIINHILNMNFDGITTSLDSNGTSVNFAISSGSSEKYKPRVVVKDTGSTGAEIIITETSNALKSSLKFYIGKTTDSDDWCDLNNWTNNISFSSAYKTIIETL